MSPADEITSSYAVVPPTADDAEAMGRVHVRAWQAAYRGGLMPDEYLDGLDPGERAEFWREGLARPVRERFTRLVVVAEDGPDAGEVVGHLTCGPASGDPDAVDGELYSINIDPGHWGRGAGPILMAAGTEALIAAGFPEAVLWVHPDNGRAIRFYEARGWVDDGERRTDEVLGVDVPEARYRLRLQSGVEW